MGIQETFAANMRKYRKQAHLSQAKLAELAHLHRTYIGGIEQKRINVSLKNIGKIADALEIDPAQLFLSDGSEPESDGTRNALTSALLDTAAFGETKADSTVPEDALQEDADFGGGSDVIGVTGVTGVADTADAPSDYALRTWRDGRPATRSVEVAHEDLTVQILYNLIRDGYTGDDLADRYSEVQREILSLLETS